LKGGRTVKADRFAKINEIIAEVLNMDEGDIESQMSLVDDLGADELDVMEILMDVEDEYGISLTDAEFVGIKTVDDICRVIIGRQGV